MLPSWLHSAFVAALAGPPSPAPAPPVLPEEEPATAPTNSREDTVIEAEKAWNEANWARVRELLTPIADNETLDDPLERERILVTLADATVQDTSLPDADRRARAGEHLVVLMEADATWKLKEGIYSPELYDVYLDKREERVDNAGSRCKARLNACTADNDTAAAELRQKEKEYDELKRKYDAEDVYVGVQRSRAAALIPLGVSHFLNAGRGRGPDVPTRVKVDRALGATFLTLEAAAGLAGLALLIHRVTALGCERTSAFQRGSLDCTPRIEVSEAQVVQRRKAEEGMAWVFFSAIAVDIVLAQIRFDDFRLEYKQSRSELEAERAGGRKRRRRKREPRAKVRPAPAFIPGGAGAGINVRF